MTRALVFDSGVGGLTIADELRKAAPDWIVDYAADSGFFPYGVKTDDELRERLPRLCAALVDVAKPDVLVIACNTASTLSPSGIAQPTTTSPRARARSTWPSAPCGGRASIRNR